MPKLLEQKGFSKPPSFSGGKDLGRLSGFTFSRSIGFMPVEVLTREEIEKIVEEKLKKLLGEMEISKKIVQLESSTAELKDTIAKLSVKQGAVAQSVAQALNKDLAERADLLQIRTTLDSVTLKPKSYLAAQDFRAVSDVVRMYGGSWSSARRMFVVRKRS
jgi:hypothetical protein